MAVLFFLYSEAFHRDLLQHHKPQSATPALQKEPEEMDEQLSVVFQVSKFKYLSLPDSLNYYFFKGATRDEEKKEIYHKRLLWGKGGRRMGEH